MKYRAVFINGMSLFFTSISKTRVILFTRINMIDFDKLLDFGHIKGGFSFWVPLKQSITLGCVSEFEWFRRVYGEWKWLCLLWCKYYYIYARLRCLLNGSKIYWFRKVKWSSYHNQLKANEINDSFRTHFFFIYLMYWTWVTSWKENFPVFSASSLYGGE